MLKPVLYVLVFVVFLRVGATLWNLCLVLIYVFVLSVFLVDIFFMINVFLETNPAIFK